ncbi:hypothetical protein I317_06628 [Kwoniella heveanensis CBS 569]|uniref:Uncharacterized protein n=1 Tax=Kwoniella heveanensis BCC8398 TaxID=1296120 RepID=A0A1B9GXG6_9TREE|nr:hypothetical protein I316_02767 [Kwoniella heveanensis BCC8398]OCF39566.1 hypothetical protein I317_06628 [Kwoniella heveanensis CBS 569]
MAPPPSVAYATLSAPLPSNPYILSITPSPTTPHLILRHPSAELTIADNQTLQPVDRLRDGHKGLISSVAADAEGGALWSAGKDANIVRWDERSRRAASVIKAFVRKPLPVTALAVSSRDHLVIGGTELVSSEAHILFWDDRNPSQPAYSHTSTHSDDITHLSILPTTSTFLRSSGLSSSSSSGAPPLPDKLLLSSSTDGLVALSNMKETDEDEAVLAAENWGQSIADARAYLHKGKMRVWARSDMDAVAIWEAGKGPEDELELQNLVEYPTESFKFKDFKPPQQGAHTVQTATEEREAKHKLKSDYLIDVCPSLGISKYGVPITAVGTNDGDIVLQHQHQGPSSSSTSSTYVPSAYLLTGPTKTRGHKDVIRALYHDLSNEAIYTGSEDGVLSGWSLASLPERLVVGDPEIDDEDADRGDDEDMEDEDEESEIETETEEESDKSDEDDFDMEKDEKERGPRYGPIIGAGADASGSGKGGRGVEGRKEKRREKRFDPY